MMNPAYPLRRLSESALQDSSRPHLAIIQSKAYLAVSFPSYKNIQYFILLFLPTGVEMNKLFQLQTH